MFWIRCAAPCPSRFRRSLWAALHFAVQTLSGLDVFKIRQICRHDGNDLVLCGARPGEGGGQLTEKIRRKPYSVVLFDEVEKAHPDVFNILLQILDDGRLTDSKGRVVDFKNTIIIMTSNAGAETIKSRRTLGFEENSDRAEREYDAMKDKLFEALKAQFRPEFLNRVDDIIVFHNLEREDIRQIADIMIKSLAKRLKDKDIQLSVTPAAMKQLIEDGYDKEYGARPLRRVIQRKIEDKLSEEILLNKIKYGKKVSVDYRDGEFAFVEN